MKLSQRISSLSASPTISLNAKAKALKAAGKDILNFSVGEPDFDTPQVIVDQAVEALKAGKTRYGPAGGGADVRQAIADKLQAENQLS